MLSMTTDNVDEKKVDRAYSKALKSKAIEYGMQGRANGVGVSGE